MLESPAKQRQLWIIQRLQRICTDFRNMSDSEPCFEQYEQQVARMMNEEVTDAAAAWIQLIAVSLRTGTPFIPTEYLK
ncbi:MAG: hypothetical protein R3C59_29070 [Planctomycetaceae bacterium]